MVSPSGRHTVLRIRSVGLLSLYRVTLLKGRLILVIANSYTSSAILADHSPSLRLSYSSLIGGLISLSRKLHD